MSATHEQIAIFLPLLVAVGTVACTIIIHGLALIAIVHYSQSVQNRGVAGRSFWIDVTIVAATTFLAFAAHLVEIATWAIVFVLAGEFPYYSTAFYHSAVNYTTLGYGDIIMSPSWRLLGPLEGTDGALMFGLSTGMIFAVVLHLVQIRFRVSNV
jgi:hypothetical protein